MEITLIWAGNAPALSHYHLPVDLGIPWTPKLGICGKTKHFWNEIQPIPRHLKDQEHPWLSYSWVTPRVAFEVWRLMKTCLGLFSPSFQSFCPFLPSGIHPSAAPKLLFPGWIHALTGLEFKSPTLPQKAADKINNKHSWLKKTWKIIWKKTPNSGIFMLQGKPINSLERFCWHCWSFVLKGIKNATKVGQGLCLPLI